MATASRRLRITARSRCIRCDGERPHKPSRGRAIIDRSPVHVHDVTSDEGAEFPKSAEMSRRDGGRTVLGVPMLREGDSIGAIVLRRAEVQPFSDKQVALLQTFANQAVIAIGNVRLFDEVQAKTRDLTEALTYQTGSGQYSSRDCLLTDRCQTGSQCNR